MDFENSSSGYQGLLASENTFFKSISVPNREENLGNVRTEHEAGDDGGVDGASAGETRPIFVGFDGLAHLEVWDQKALIATRGRDGPFL